MACLETKSPGPSVVTKLPAVAALLDLVISELAAQFSGVDDKQLDPLPPELVSLLTVALARRRRMDEEALQKLASALPSVEDISLANWESLTQSQLEDLLSKKLPSIQSLDLAGCYRITSLGLLESLPIAPRLRSLNLRHCRGLRDGGASVIRASIMPNLRYLVLAGTGMTDPFVKQLVGLPLTHLDLTSCRVSTGLVELCEAQPPLRFLALTQCLFPASEFKEIHRLTTLETLHVQFVSRLADEGLTGIAALTNLTDLDIARNHDIGHETLLLLPALPNLRTLNASRLATVGLPACNAIASLKNLTSLDLGYNTDVHLPPLSALKQLDTLNLAYLPITDTLLCDTLKHFPALRQLKINGCERLTDKAVQTLPSLLPSLTSLDIGGSGITARCLPALNTFPLLARVGIWSTGIKSPQWEAWIVESPFEPDTDMATHHGTFVMRRRATQLVDVEKA